MTALAERADPFTGRATPLAEAALSRLARETNVSPDGIRGAVVRATSHHFPGGTRYTTRAP